MQSSSFYTVPQDEGSWTEPARMEHTLQDAPIPHGRLPELTARGRTLKTVSHPLLSQGHAWIAERQVNARSQSSFIVLNPIPVYHAVADSY